MKHRAATRGLRRQATLRRAVSLLTDFRFEQSDPGRFYGHIAADTVMLLEALYRDTCGDELHGKTILDVGGGPGYFADRFDPTGAHYVPVEPDPSELHAAGLRIASAVRGSGMALPFKTDSVDICFSSNVAEHIRDPWKLGDEMVRVTKPGGLVVLSYTVWLGPFGGHETGRFAHWLGGQRAADRYARKHGKRPKNDFGNSLFAVTAKAGLNWAQQQPDADLVAAFPRYHPRWAWWATKVPGLRELLTSNLVLVLRKPQEPGGGPAES